MVWEPEETHVQIRQQELNRVIPALSHPLCHVSRPTEGKKPEYVDNILMSLFHIFIHFTNMSFM